MKNNLTEELKRMRELAGLIKEGAEQSTANSSEGGQKPPTQTQSPSIGNPQVQRTGQTPQAKQPAPEPKDGDEEIKELLDDAGDYAPER